MPSYAAEDNTVILPDGRFDAIVMATCKDAREAEFVAACYRAFAGVGDTTRMWLLDGGIIAKTAKRFEREAEKMARMIADEEACEAAERAAVGNAPALAAE